MKLKGKARKYLLSYLIVSAIVLLIYTFLYLIYSFIIFEFNNPFQWILDIPNYEKLTRLLIIFYYVLFLVIKTIVVIRIKEYYEIKR